MSAASIVQRPYSGKPTIGSKPGSRLASMPSGGLVKDRSQRQINIDTIMVKKGGKRGHLNLSQARQVILKTIHHPVRPSTAANLQYKQWDDGVCSQIPEQYVSQKRLNQQPNTISAHIKNRNFRRNFSNRHHGSENSHSHSPTGTTSEKRRFKQPSKITDENLDYFVPEDNS